MKKNIFKVLDNKIFIYSTFLPQIMWYLVFLLLFVLNKEEHLEEVLEVFLELDIKGATIIDSIGMGRILSTDIPIFAGFRNLMQESRPGNKTILTVITEEKIPRVIQ